MIKSANRSIDISDIKLMDERLSEELEKRLEFKGKIWPASATACGVNIWSIGICPAWACAINFLL